MLSSDENLSDEDDVAPVSSRRQNIIAAQILDAEFEIEGEDMDAQLFTDQNLDEQIQRMLSITNEHTVNEMEEAIKSLQAWSLARRDISHHRVDFEDSPETDEAPCDFFSYCQEKISEFSKTDQIDALPNSGRADSLRAILDDFKSPRRPSTLPSQLKDPWTATSITSSFASKLRGAESKDELDLKMKNEEITQIEHEIRTTCRQDSAIADREDVVIQEGVSLQADLNLLEEQLRSFSRDLDQFL